MSSPSATISIPGRSASVRQVSLVFASTMLNKASPVRNTVVFPGRGFSAGNAISVSANQWSRSEEIGSQNRKVEKVMVVQAPNPSALIRTTIHPDTNAPNRMDPTHIPMTKNAPR